MREQNIISIKFASLAAPGQSSDFIESIIDETFHCTKYKVDQARKLKSLANGLEIPKKATITRSKFNIQKCEHFLDCLLTNKLL